MGFYDQDWSFIRSKHPLIAKKIEELRCESVAYEQYELEIKLLHKDVKELQAVVAKLARLKVAAK